MHLNNIKLKVTFIPGHKKCICMSEKIVKVMQFSNAK